MGYYWKVAHASENLLGMCGANNTFLGSNFNSDFYY